MFPSRYSACLIGYLSFRPQNYEYPLFCSSASWDRFVRFWVCELMHCTASLIVMFKMAVFSSFGDILLKALWNDAHSPLLFSIYFCVSRCIRFFFLFSFPFSGCSLRSVCSSSLPNRTGVRKRKFVSNADGGIRNSPSTPQYVITL